MDGKYQQYYDAFILASQGKLKSGIGIKCQFFPFSGGALVRLDLLNGVPDSAIQRKEEDSLSNALYRTGVFDAEVCNRFADKTVKETLYFIATTRVYLIFKSESDNEWSKESASRDFVNIVSKVKEKYAKK